MSGVLMRLSLPESALRRYLQGSRDFHYEVSPQGWIATRCKRCQEVLDLKAVDGLLWLRCPECRRLSLTPLANVFRDQALAARDGQSFAYEMFYFEELPEGLSSPF